MEASPAHSTLHRKHPTPAEPFSGWTATWTRTGPMFLKDERIATMLVRTLHQGAEQGHYELGPFVVMANHVHVLLRPLIDPSRLLQSLKGASAREANVILGRTGQPFWQRESYDRRVRDAGEWERIAAYIENNPVKAGLVPSPGEYRWSSAKGRRG